MFSDLFQLKYTMPYTQKSFFMHRRCVEHTHFDSQRAAAQGFDGNLTQNGPKVFKMPYNRRRICEDATSQFGFLTNPNAKSSNRTLSLNVFPAKI